MSYSSIPSQKTNGMGPLLEACARGIMAICGRGQCRSPLAHSCCSGQALRIVTDDPVFLREFADGFRSEWPKSTPWWMISLRRCGGTIPPSQGLNSERSNETLGAIHRKSPSRTVARRSCPATGLRGFGAAVSSSLSLPSTTRRNGGSLAAPAMTRQSSRAAISSAVALLRTVPVEVAGS